MDVAIEQRRPWKKVKSVMKYNKKLRQPTEQWLVEEFKGYTLTTTVLWHDWVRGHPPEFTTVLEAPDGSIVLDRRQHQGTIVSPSVEEALDGHIGFCSRCGQKWGDAK